MEITNTLLKFGIIPFDTATLVAALGGYKSPKDKVAALEQEGRIIRLKRGVYVLSPSISHQSLSKELMANHLYGPSYVSMQSALAGYGLIPERVFTQISMTTKRSRRFSTPLGNFDYVGILADYFSIGVRQEIVNNEYAFLIATPEKALCDLIINTAGLKLQSSKALQIYLEEDLRIDFSVIHHWDIEIVKQCIEQGMKKNELNLLSKFLKAWNEHEP
jgi:hypothetical protein